MAKMDNISKKERVIARKPGTQPQSELASEANQIGAAVDQFEKSAAVEAPAEQQPQTFSVPPEKTDPEPMFPGSAKAAVPASVMPQTPAKPDVFEVNETKDKRWKFFGWGFLLGSVVIGGLIIFLLTAAYGTTNANLKTKNTQLQSQVQSLQKINQGTTGVTSGSSTITNNSSVPAQ